jgi:transposase
MHPLSHKPPLFLTQNKVMKKVTIFETVHEAAAGIDIGASRIFVSPDGVEVVSFETYTTDYHQCIAYLQEKGIKRVAMEATGVYWMALYAMLEACGFEVCLVNPKETRQVKGRKTDVQDCRWIQKLFAAGILRKSFIPEGRFMELRQLVRERLDMIEMGSTYVHKMQKCLELMNIKLTEVISEIHGVSGIKMISAIISGNRDRNYLLGLCDSKIRNRKSDQVLKALEGTYNETYLFILEQDMLMWQNHERCLAIIDKRIEQLLSAIEPKAISPIPDPGQKTKRIRHHKPEITDFHYKMNQLYGVDLNRIPGINDYTALRLAGEVGINAEHFPTLNQFVSWCGLSPKQHQSGLKNKSVKGMKCNKAGQIFKIAAQSLLNSKDCAIGVFMRKLRAKKGAPIAIKAGARKIATAFYNALTNGIGYMEQGIRNYEEQIRQQEKRRLINLAKKYNLQLTEN